MQFSDKTKRSLKIVIYLIVASFVWTILGIFVAEVFKSAVLDVMFTVSNAALSFATLIFSFKLIGMGSKDMLVELVRSKLKPEDKVQPTQQVQPKPGNNVVISDYPDAANSNVYYYSKQFVYDCV
jgi:signal peptidase I